MIVDVTGRSVSRLSKIELRKFVRRAVRAVERADAAPFRPTEVSIVLVGDKKMASLNRVYRRKNKTTDILTFGADPEEADTSRPLGELVISVDQASRQARELRHSLATEIRYLVLHGILHAFGYDHERDEGQMNALELQLREVLGL